MTSAIVKFEMPSTSKLSRAVQDSELHDGETDASVKQTGDDEMRCGRPRSAFLALPGELRNAIYDRLEPADLSNDCKGLNALSKTCRLLRQEVRPLYLARKVIRVSIRRLHLYLQAYYPDASLENMGSYVGHIEVDLNIARPSKEAVDLLPALAHLLKCPGVEVAFTGGAGAETQVEATDIQKLFNTIRFQAKAEWQAYMGISESIQLPCYPSYTGLKGDGMAAARVDRSAWNLKILLKDEAEDVWAESNIPREARLRVLLRDLGLRLQEDENPFIRLGSNLYSFIDITEHCKAMLRRESFDMDGDIAGW